MPLTQAHRVGSVTTPLGGDVLLLKSMTGREGVSELFSLHLDLYSEEKLDLDFASLIGQAVSVQIGQDSEAPRHFHGIVARLSQADIEGKFAVYRAEVVPWLWLLTRRTDCRIFQGKSVPDILEEVFGAFDFAQYRLELGGSYEPLHYCVQYRETDFNFISRLMEQEGLFYYFEHEKSRHVLVITDDSSACPTCPGQSAANYVGPGRQAGDGEIGAWLCEQELHPGRYALTDYNFHDPSTDLLVNTPSTVSIGQNDRFEIFDYPGGYTNVGAETDAKLEKGDRWVRLRMQAEEAAAVTVRGFSRCAAFSPGYTFDLAKHFRRDYNGKYFISSVQHAFHQGTTFGGDDAYTNYENSFTCLPRARPYRARRSTPTPFIQGPQTAVVVGVSGEEVDVDQYGRVKIQFHWDRLGKRDENSSCWVRVAQTIAGKGWGFLSHPRIGQEVVVEFLDGDPNRPLVTGVVYNAEQTPPYDLPNERTRTGFLSRSTLDGGPDNANELRFDDKKGEEELHLHAERNLTIVVENDSDEQIQHDRIAVVENADTTTVKQGDRKVVVESGKDALVVQRGDASVEVSLGSRKVSAPTGTHELDALKVVLKAATELSLECGAGKISINAGGIVTIQGTLVKIN